MKCLGLMILEIFSDLSDFIAVFPPPRRLAPFLEVLDGAWSTQNSPRKIPQGILSKPLDLKETEVFCGGELVFQPRWEMDPSGLILECCRIPSPLSPSSLAMGAGAEPGDIPGERDTFNRVLQEGAFFDIPDFP